MVCHISMVSVYDLTQPIATKATGTVYIIFYLHTIQQDYCRPVMLWQHSSDYSLFKQYIFAEHLLFILALAYLYKLLFVIRCWCIFLFWHSYLDCGRLPIFFNTISKGKATQI